MYSRYAYTLHFVKTGPRYVSTEAQSILNEHQVYKILRVQINVIEKEENTVQNRNQNVYFPMFICNNEAESCTEAVFCNQGTFDYCLNPILKVRVQTVFQIFLLSFFDFMSKKIQSNNYTKTVRFLIHYGRYT